MSEKTTKRIVRQIDVKGRFCIPSEFQNNLDLKHQDSVAIIKNENQLHIKKTDNLVRSLDAGGRIKFTSLLMKKLGVQAGDAFEVSQENDMVILKKI